MDVSYLGCLLTFVFLLNWWYNRDICWSMQESVMELIRFNILFRSRRKWIIGYRTNVDFPVWWFYIQMAPTTVELLAEDANATEAYWTGVSYRTWQTLFLLYCFYPFCIQSEFTERRSLFQIWSHSHLEANPSNRGVICQTKSRRHELSVLAGWYVHE